MWKVLKWLVIGGVLLLILSDVQISTSLYKYDDNNYYNYLSRLCRISD